jgi:V8-like Glu-specific endopeptidase
MVSLFLSLFFLAQEDTPIAVLEYKFSAQRHVEVFSQRTIEVEEKDPKTGNTRKVKKTLDPEFIGSGVFIDKGKVLTAKHVVEAKDWDGNEFKPVYVRFCKTLSGTGVAEWEKVDIKNWRVSPTSDLAVLYLDDDSVGVFTEIGENPNIGDSVFNTSSPFSSLTFSRAHVHSYAKIFYSSDSVTLSLFVVANTSARSNGYKFEFVAIGHNLVVAPGSSGSGVYHNFKLVGIHVASTYEYPTFAYAVPASDIRAFLK